MKKKMKKTLSLVAVRAALCGGPAFGGAGRFIQ